MILAGNLRPTFSTVLAQTSILQTGETEEARIARIGW